VQKKANETAFKTFSSLQSFLGTMGKIGSFAQRGFFIPHTNMSFGETRPQLVFSQTSSPPEMFGSFSLSGFFCESDAILFFFVFVFFKSTQHIKLSTQLKFQPT